MILTAVMADSPWTTVDRDRVAAAIVDLATGKRVASVSYAATGRTVSYVASQLGELQALLAQINRALGAGPTYRLATTRNGLGGPTGNTSGSAGSAQ